MADTDMDRFVAQYGGVYEHSPWVAEQAFAQIECHSDAREIRAALAACVDAADHSKKLTLIRAHPDLAGKAAVRGELTGESTDEQRSAGIDQCSPEEFAQFQSLNEAYKEKFGFPFVMAVRHRSRHDILASFAKRIDNDPDIEFTTAISEIHRIARLRLDVIASEDQG